jgi:hypothetical protein
LSGSGFAIPSLLLFLAVVGSAPPAEWPVARRIDGIELYSQFAPDLDSLEQAIRDVREELEASLGVRSNQQPIQILLFADQAGYLQYLARALPQARERRALYYLNGEVSQIYAWNNRSLLTDIRHELTHALLHQHLPFLPLWLDEGLAELLEEPSSARAKSRRTTAARWKARTGWKPDLASLERIRSAESMGAEEYRDSWAWTCFLMNDGPESRELLSAYLQQIHQGAAPGPFSRFAEAKMPDVLPRANSYFRRFTIAVASDSSSAPGPTASSPTEAASR